MPDRKLEAFFRHARCTTPDIGLLQPADPILNAAGEDLRRRIFMTADEGGQAWCLRPEFTIPVCLRHIEGGKAKQRYGYVGKVFRHRTDEPHEFVQAGIEDIGAKNLIAADTRSLSDCVTMLRELGAGKLAVTTGDQAIFEAVLESLGLPDSWQTRLGRAFGDPVKLTGGSYRLTYTDTSGGYALVDRATGNAVSAASVGITITPPGTTVVGEAFVIEPTRRAAEDIRVGIGDTRLVAAAGPMRSVAGGSNLGSAAVDALKVTSVAGFASGSPHLASYSITYNGSSQYEVRDASNTLIGTVAYNPATDSAGVTRTLPAPLGGIDITLSGVPSTGDSFTLESNTNGVADSTNAVALGALQTAKTLLGAGGNPTASYQSTYSNLVSQIGNKTNEIKVSMAAQEGLLEQATASREGLSGVNLDEEAANLIRYQQAYQASARVMSVASTLFDEILSIAR